MWDNADAGNVNKAERDGRNMTGRVLGPAEGLRGGGGRTWLGRAWNAASTYLHYMQELLFPYEGH